MELPFKPEKLTPEEIRSLSLSIMSGYVSAAPIEIQLGWIMDFFDSLDACTNEQKQEIAAIYSTKSLDEAMPEIIALLMTESTAELEGPIK